MHFAYLEDYLDYMIAVRSRSENTVKEYAYDISLFFKYILAKKSGCRKPDDDYLAGLNYPDAVNDELIKSIKLQDLYAFFSWLAGSRNNGAAARARRMAALRSFFDFLHKKLKVIDENPCEELETPKKTRALPEYLEYEEAVELLKTAAVKEGPNAERDYCILALFLNCGMRLSELCSINRSDLRDDYLVVKGKGNKERTVYLNDNAIDALNAWLPVRQTLPYCDDALFVSRNKKRIATRTVQHMVKNLIIEAGLDPDKYSVHKLRHTAATLMYQSGNTDIRSLQEILGHESVATTEIYTHLNQDILHAAVMSNPLNDQRYQKLKKK